MTQLVHAVMLSPTLPGTLGRYLPIMAIHVKAHENPLQCMCIDRELEAETVFMFFLVWIFSLIS